MAGNLLSVPDWSLEPIPFEQLPNLSDADWQGAITAFGRHGADSEASRRYATGQTGVDPAMLASLAIRAQSAEARADPAAFFRDHFDICAVATSPAEGGFVTGYFEPVVGASRARTADFSTPIYRTPPDLRKHTLYHHDRAAVTEGALAGRGLEIAWVKDPVVAFFIHVQGAARLIFDDGAVGRITFAGKTGHPFTAIGRHLVSIGEIPAAAISMQTIRDWLYANQHRATDIMNLNRSFIFFRETDVGVAGEGPIAAAKIPLTAGYSLAVDKTIHTFGTPVFVSAADVNGRKFKRLMIAQDTGSAIVGPARGDIFFGSGNDAGQLAGAVKSPASFAILVPRSSANG